MLRAYNFQSDAHFFTSNSNELAFLPGNGSSGFLCEDVAFYIFKDQVNGTVPIQRLYYRDRDDKGIHFYTTDKQKAEELKNRDGWRWENESNQGNVGYVYPVNMPKPANTLTVHRLFNKNSKGYLLTTSDAERDAALATTAWELDSEAFGYIKN
jgi:hypothetical protein